MNTWKDTPDDIFLQAHLNHVIRVWGSHPDVPEDKAHLVIKRAKKHYETFPDHVEALEEEIVKLTHQSEN